MGPDDERNGVLRERRDWTEGFGVDRHGGHSGNVKSDDINAHTKTNQILWHHADMTRPDERINMMDEPDHDALCEREQRYLLKAIDEDVDLSDHMNDAVKSLRF